MTNAANLSTHELMELHINTLFCCDAEGRLRAVNEAGEPPAPLFYMGRTLQGNFWRFRYDLPAAAIEKLEHLCRSEPVATKLSELSSPPQQYAAIHAVINEIAPRQDRPEYRGPAYWIPANRDPEGNQRAANVVLISESNANLLPSGFAWMLPLAQSSELEPIVAAIVQDIVQDEEHEQAVAICFCSRRPAQATEAGVETLAAFRGRGYATAIVATWAAEVSKRGCIPLYSTSWDNLASQAVARKLQMVMYGEDWSIQ